MSTPRELSSLTFEELLGQEERSEVRHRHIDGRLYAIFEVLSKSTEVFDRTGKFDEYQQIEELTDYILIDAERTRVGHFTKLDTGEWALRVFISLAQELLLKNFAISVPLAEIYEVVEIATQAILPEICDEQLLQN